ncbi:hypothetical protein CORT_0G02200 [Candida orthopsilosis Co 90-125]|uniref:Altered inheritance of mitochondria protein 32 n=1 Tax=Candida orthopsilosis (strain 90-125) TaxID=1136231 RepID=H8XAQ0_CANO9|nr:hypothetical protein CORT_0G02200 [Candida orthopsilosis Co 90-125]CCG24901.1 hypothetical protein CORT_0G02200 [Candida orthopsilosis Co 90-125]
MMIRLILKRFHSTDTFSSRISWKLINPKISIQQDCAFCQQHFPHDKQINFEQDLDKSAAVPSKHVMVLTTKHNRIEDFESRIENWSGTLAHEVHKLRFKVPLRLRTSISSIVLRNNDEILRQYGVNHHAGDQLVFIYPEMKIVKFNIAHTAQFVSKYLKSENEEEIEIFNPFARTLDSSTKLISKIKINDANFQEWHLNKDLIVICGHAKRDIRCGILGPILVDKFNDVLTAKSMDDGAYLGEVTHVGGHAFAGNVLYYPKECSTSHDFIWYGRVFPEHVEMIVGDTIVNKQIIKSLFRGDCHQYSA